MQPIREFLPRKLTIVHEKQKSFATKLLVAQLISILVYQAALQVRLVHYLKRSTTIETWEVVSRIMSESFITLFIVGAITSVLLYLLGLWQSHRMLGPIPRFRAALRRVATGDTSVRFHFRPGDYLEDVGDDFNAAMDAMDRRQAPTEASETRDETTPRAA